MRWRKRRKPRPRGRPPCPACGAPQAACAAQPRRRLDAGICARLPSWRCRRIRSSTTAPICASSRRCSAIPLSRSAAAGRRCRPTPSSGRARAAPMLRCCAGILSSATICRRTRRAGDVYDAAVAEGGQALPVAPRPRRHRHGRRADAQGAQRAGRRPHQAARSLARAPRSASISSSPSATSW